MVGYGAYTTQTWMMFTMDRTRQGARSEVLVFAFKNLYTVSLPHGDMARASPLSTQQKPVRFQTGMPQLHTIPLASAFMVNGAG